jgi:prevent-host-death family protein
MRAFKLSQDVRPVTDLKSHGAEIIRQVEEGGTVVVSKHGRAVAVVLSIGEYESLQETADQAALLRAVEEAEAEIASGLGIPHAQMRKKFATRIARDGG